MWNACISPSRFLAACMHDYIVYVRVQIHTHKKTCIRMRLRYYIHMRRRDLCYMPSAVGQSQVLNPVTLEKERPAIRMMRSIVRPDKTLR